MSETADRLKRNIGDDPKGERLRQKIVNVSIGALPIDQEGFVEGVNWVNAQLFEAARRLKENVRGSVVRESDGKEFDIITHSARPQFASLLEKLAEEFLREGLAAAKAKYPHDV